MGRKGSWFSSVKKALTPQSKESKEQSQKSKKKKWFGIVKAPPKPDVFTPAVPPLSTEVKLAASDEDQQTKHAYSVAVATAAAAEAAVAAAQAAAEVVRLTSAAQVPGKSKEEAAAVRIQTAFRGYMSRRALRALRGLVRLKAFVGGSSVKRQTTNALKGMQNVGRVQAQIQARRIRMLEENQALQRHILQKRAKEESLQMGGDWDDSLQSKEQLEAGLLNKYEAAMRRERALAYSYSHQQTWKKSARPAILMFMDPNNPNWGWSWLERCTETATQQSDRESNKDLKSNVNEIAKAFARYQLNININNSEKTTHQPPLPSTPQSKSRKGKLVATENDTRSVFSVQSERNRRHSIAGSSVRDDESLASSPSVPSYMGSTQSAKAKSRVLQSPLGLENRATPPEKASLASVKKRLSFPVSSTARPRRLSGPPRIETSLEVAAA